MRMSVRPVAAPEDGVSPPPLGPIDYVLRALSSSGQAGRVGLGLRTGLLLIVPVARMPVLANVSSSVRHCDDAERQ